MTTSITDSMQAFAFTPRKGRDPERCDARPWHQKGSKCSYISYGEGIAFAKDHTNLSEEEFSLYKTPEGIVALNKEGISIAVEKRVALFFQQATLCYGLESLKFSAENADMQVGSSPALQLRSGNTRKLYKREAAHSSTVPTLIARAQDGTSFVFLKGSSSYYEQNGTIGMSESVNGADELLDGKGADNQLRMKTIELVNKVAQKILNPVDATKEFEHHFKTTSEDTAKSLPETDVRKAVLLKYSEILEKVRQDDVLFDQLLGINIDPNNLDAEKVRQEIYPRKYALLQWQETIESRIAYRMDSIRKQLGKKSGPLLEHLLLKTVAKDSDLKTFEKLFSKTFSFQEITPEEDDQKAYKSFLTRIANLQKKHAQELGALISDIRKDFTELKEKETAYKKDLLEALQKTNPDFDSSSSLLLPGLFIS